MSAFVAQGWRRPGGGSAHPVNMNVSWVQNDANQFGLYLCRLVFGFRGLGFLLRRQALASCGLGFSLCLWLIGRASHEYSCFAGKPWQAAGLGFRFLTSDSWY